MVGGGKGAFIGEVHRKAAALDGYIELVCGAFSSSPEKSKATGKELFLPENRAYGTFEEMIEKEKELPEGERMDFVSIVTPNFLHFPPAKLALENGFHVVCDKPMTVSLEQAKELQTLVKETGLMFALTHNYTGYPMVKQAAHMVKDGELGAIRKVVVEYPQGWLSTKEEEATWRTDPEKAGPVGAMGDIGTHAENLAEYVTGLEITELCADLTSFVDGRKLDDDGNVLLRLENGAKGVLHASQISSGEENPLKIYVYGEKGGLEWHQEEPNTLYVKRQDQPEKKFRTGNPYICENATFNTRLPAGHPEGFIEAFGNIYKNFALALGSRMSGEDPKSEYLDFPTVDDGVRGMAFIDTVVKSNESDKKWTEFVK